MITYVLIPTIYLFTNFIWSNLDCTVSQVQSQSLDVQFPNVNGKLPLLNVHHMGPRQGTTPQAPAPRCESGSSSMSCQGPFMLQAGAHNDR